METDGKKSEPMTSSGSIILVDVENYPGVKLDDEHIAELEQQLAKAKSEKEKLIKSIQLNVCTHNKRKIYREDKHYFYGLERSRAISLQDDPDGKLIFLGEECIHCRVFFPKKEGGYLQVCAKCPGEMSFWKVDNLWGQKAAIYRCTGCPKEGVEGCGHTSYSYEIPSGH